MAATTNDSHSDLTPPLLGLYVDEAIGRAEAIVAALTVHAHPDDDDVAWARMAAHSLRGLTAQAGHTPLVTEVQQIEDALARLVSVDATDRTVAAADIVSRLNDVQRRLTEHAGPGVSRDLELEEIAQSAATEVQRVARRRDIQLSVELVVPPNVMVPRRIAGVVVDVMGHVLRNAVTHGSPHGGAIRIAFAREPDALSIVVGDRGNAQSRDAERAPDGESGRGVGLQAARSRLTAIGGELVMSPAPWGGTTVTIRVPILPRHGSG